jgi:hypothetical protein
VTICATAPPSGSATAAAPTSGSAARAAGQARPVVAICVDLEKSMRFTLHFDGAWTGCRPARCRPVDGESARVEFTEPWGGRTRDRRLAQGAQPGRDARRGVAGKRSGGERDPALGQGPLFCTWTSNKDASARRRP